MTKTEIEAEIMRCEKAIQKTKSDCLVRDYTKHINKLKRELAKLKKDGVKE